MFPSIDRAISFQTAPGTGVIIISGKKYERERTYEKKRFSGYGDLPLSLLKGLPFEPGGDPHVLILGSFPSTLSLEAGAYYANPRNQFWKIMEFHLGIPEVSTYTEKLAGLKNNNIGLWDVIFSCERQGAMDHAIRNATPNDIPLFLNDHPTVRMVIANGTTAGMYLEQFRLKWPSRVSLHILPSTSPANARTPFSEKLRVWAVMLEAV